jgi:hypothetical protein
MLDAEVYVVVHESDGAALVGDFLHTKSFLYKYVNKSAPCGKGFGVPTCSNANC